MFTKSKETEVMTLAEKTEKVFKDCEKLLFDAMKASGLDISSIAEADDDSIILFKRYMEVLKDAEDLAIAQAAQLDKIDMIDQVFKSTASIAADLKVMDKKVDILIGGSKK